MGPKPKDCNPTPLLQTDPFENMFPRDSKCHLIVSLLVPLALSPLQGCSPAKPPQPEVAEAEALPPISSATLRMYAEQGDLESVKKAIERGTDLNKADESGRTPLMVAALFNHHEIVAELLKQKIKIDARDGAGRTALMYAASGPSAKTVELLLEAGAEVNAQDNDERFTPLMYAAAEGQLEVVQLLLKHKADKSMTDIDNDTARNFAIQNNHLEVAEALK